MINSTLYYLALSGMLCVLLLIPCVLNSAIVWGIPVFTTHYPNRKFVNASSTIPVWVQRAQRTHLSMVETLPAFTAVVLAAYFTDSNQSTVATWAAIFFWARLFHATIYILGIPYLRTPIYLISWASVLIIGLQVVF